MTDERPIGEDDLHALVDGRLTPDRQAVVDAYLRGDPGARERVEADRAGRDALRDRLAFKAREPLPSRLRVATLLAERRRRLRRAATGVAAGVALTLLGGAAGWSAHAWLAGTPGSRAGGPEMAAVVANALRAHRTYAVEIAHPVEVPGSQEAHLVQWLSKRLGRPLRAPDLQGSGYRLVGGRLLPAGSGPAAQFMYEDPAGARLTVYVETGTAAETAFRFAQGEGVSAFSWIEDGFSYVVAGGLARDPLLAVAEAIYRQNVEPRRGQAPL
ncbi:anti-sigma factor family protein [Salinarimonas soli]|uniref:Anti-sigma factor n=1 Tax=Salinarimonas soli TaxID=1638099 RepID=A0A5B2V9K1_9HYPH|nr:anti-sigma factor [Salinarimonas soli]KAA2234917.1 anti-sigma factor [Salinarimonas soli]